MKDEFDDPMNPGVDVVRRARRRIAEACGFDLHRLAERVRRREEFDIAASRRVISTPFETSEPAA